MIYDRTQADIDSSIKIRSEKIKFDEAGEHIVTDPLTDSELETLERGTLSINTLNRIEQKQAELVGLFNGIGYYNIVTINKTWSIGDDFFVEDIQRVIANEKKLIDAFFVYKDTPQLPTSFLAYEDTNSVEKILHDLDVMINDVKSNYRECGNFNCGGDVS